MSLIKLALEEQKKSFVQRHPLITAGVGLTAGIAAADAGLASFNKIRELGGGKAGAFKSGLKQFAENRYGVRKKVGDAALHGLGQGAIYGGILSAAEPLVTHGIMGQREKNK